MSNISKSKVIEIRYNKRIYSGTSVSFQKNIYDTLIYSHMKGYYSIQFFLGSYISLKRSIINDNDIFKFKQIVIEFHDYLNETRLELIKKLTINHVLIHLHANNCCGLIDFNGIKFPNIVELTFIRKSEISNHAMIKLNNQPLPVISLDYPNLKDKPEIRLDYYPFMTNDVQG